MRWWLNLRFGFGIYFFSPLLLFSVKRVLLEVGVELTQLKSIRRVPLVLSGGVIAFAILGTYEADDFADFAFLGHDSNLLARRYVLPKEDYG